MQIFLVQKIVSNFILQMLKTEKFSDYIIECLSCRKKKFAGQKLFSVFGPATFLQFKSETKVIINPS